MKTKKNFLKWIILFLIIFVLFIFLVNIFEFIFKEIYISHIKNNLTTSYILHHINFFNDDDKSKVPILIIKIKSEKKVYFDAYNAKVALFNIGTWIINFTSDIGSIFIGSFQDIITILFSGSIFYNAIGIDYITYFWIILGIFFFFLLVFLGAKFLKIGIRKGTSDNIGKHIFNSFVLLIMIVLIIQILFLGTKYIFVNVIGIKDFSFNVFSKIKNFTIGKIDTPLMRVHSKYLKFSKKITIPIEIDGIIVLKIKLIIGLKFTVNWVKFNFTPIIVAYLVAFIFSIYFILINLIKFLIKLFTGIIDVFFFSFIGLPLAAASSVEDNGNKMNNWNRTLMKKAFNPLLLFSTYLFVLIFINSIFSLIDNISFSESFSEETIKTIIFSLKFIVINGAFLFLNSSSKKINKKSLILKANNYDENILFNSEKLKKIDYSFFNQINIDSYQKYHQEKDFNEININTTLEKIKRKE